MTESRPNPAHNVASVVRGAAFAALAFGVVDALRGIAVGGHLWSSANPLAAVTWSVGVWSLVALVPACLLLLLATLRRASVTEMCAASVYLLLGRGERRSPVILYALTLAILPAVMEGPLTNLIVGQQLPGMVGEILADLGALVLVFVIHRSLAKWRPRFAASPWLTSALFAVFFYDALIAVSVLEPFALSTPAMLLLLSVTTAAVGSEEAWGYPKARMGLAAIVLLSLFATMVSYEGRSPTHAALTKQSLLYFSGIQMVWRATDLDGDGYSALLGGGDAPTVAAPATAAGCAPTSTDNRGEAVRDARNVILITVDTLRADHVGLAWEGRALTPYLDEFFAGSLAFGRAYAPSTHTDESVPSLMTGRYPPTIRRSETRDTLAATLSKAGFVTVAIQSMPEMPAHIVEGFGFVDNAIGEKQPAWTQVTAFESVFRAVEVLRNYDRKAPLFLWVHIMDPHAYYVRDPKLAGWLGDDSLMAHYRHEVHRTDQAVGQLLLAIDDLGYADDSVVVFTSDHGEAFGEHGRFTHAWEGYEEVIRVPLALRWPGAEPRNESSIVSLVDVFPTIVALLGLEDDQPRDGVDLRRGGGGRAYTTVHYGGDHLLDAAVEGDRKVLIDRVRNTYESYDLGNDPRERKNLGWTESAAELEARLNACAFSAAP